MGLTYSPYNNDGTCKSQDQVTKDFASISGYGFVRIYGTDCNQVETVLTAAKGKGMKVFAGITNISQLQSEINIIIKACKSSWDEIMTVSIGNELVNSNAASPAQVNSAIKSARLLLNSAGYNGKVVTTDTFVAYMNNPTLCQETDFIAANCHAFFDGGVQASDAGSFVKTQAGNVAKACGGKQVIITESGWPSGGQPNKAGVPSPANQKAAISSLQSAFASNPGDLVLFTAFNDKWKKNTATTFGAEQFWGILGDAPA
jgi:exo-beta-1,3-glucanase (GH17 family)